MYMIKRFFLLLSFCVISLLSYSQTKFPNVKMSAGQYDKMKDDMLIPTKQGTVYGFAYYGKFYIKPVFEDAAVLKMDGSKYFYLVKYSNKWGILNPDGSYLVQPVWTERPFLISNDHIVCSEGNDYTFYDKNGNQVEYKGIHYKRDWHKRDFFLYVPASITQPLYYGIPASREFQSSPFSVKRYPSHQKYLLRANYGMFLFEMDDKSFLSEYGPFNYLELDYTTMPVTHWFVRKDDSILFDEEYNVLDYCIATHVGNDYVIALTDEGIMIYDYLREKKYLEMPYEDPSTFSKSVAIRFLKDIDSRWMCKYQSYLCSSEVKDVYVNKEYEFFVVETDKGTRELYDFNGNQLYHSNTNPEFIPRYDDKNNKVICVSDGARYGFINLSNGFDSGMLFNKAIEPMTSLKRFSKDMLCDSSNDIILSSERMYTIDEYDEYLYSSFTLQNYVNDSLLDRAEKKHLEEAETILKKERRLRDIKDTKAPTRWYKKSSIIEERVDGNILTYDVYENRGFVYRQLHSRSKPNYNPEDIVIDDFGKNIYLSPYELTGFEDANSQILTLIWKKKLGDEVYAIYECKTLSGVRYTGEVSIQCAGLTINPLTGQWMLDYYPVAHSVQEYESLHYIVIINKEGIVKTVAFTGNFDDIQPCDDYIKVTGGGEFVCLDYDLNEIFMYKSKSEPYINDCVRFGNAWVLVGYTYNAGYVNFKNYYVELVDANGKTISKSHYPIKDGVLERVYCIDTMTFYAEGTCERLASSIKFTIDKNGNISWK